MKTVRFNNGTGKPEEVSGEVEYTAHVREGCRMPVVIVTEDDKYIARTPMRYEIPWERVHSIREYIT